MLFSVAIHNTHHNQVELKNIKNPLSIQKVLAKRIGEIIYLILLILTKIL